MASGYTFGFLKDELIQMGEIVKMRKKLVVCISLLISTILNYMYVKLYFDGSNLGFKINIKIKS
jgi:hypothetical protein